MNDLEKTKFPYSGQLEIEIYFKEYTDSVANDCRRYLHKSRNGKSPLVENLLKKLGNVSDSFAMYPRDYALLRFVPIGIDEDENKGNKRFGSGKARGGLEIYDVIGLDEKVLEKLKEVLDEKKAEAKSKKLPWFSFYRIYLREEIV